MARGAGDHAARGARPLTPRASSARPRRDRGGSVELEQVRAPRVELRGSDGRAAVRGKDGASGRRGRRAGCGSEADAGPPELPRQARADARVPRRAGGAALATRLRGDQGEVRFADDGGAAHPLRPPPPEHPRRRAAGGLERGAIRIPPPRLLHRPCREPPEIQATPPRETDVPSVHQGARGDVLLARRAAARPPRRRATLLVRADEERSCRARRCSTSAESRSDSGRTPKPDDGSTTRQS